MKVITKEHLKQDNYLMYVHTPFCGTCHLARSILNQIEETLKWELFYEMDASYYPEFMQEAKIESVPCLIIKVNGKIEKKIYAFHSVPHILSEITDFDLDSFTNHS